MEYGSIRADAVSAASRSSEVSDTAPAFPPLAVSGLVVTKADLVAALRLYDQASGTWLRTDGFATVLSSATGDMYFGYIGASKNIRFMGGGTVTQMILTPAGNVGIGNIGPAYPLDVSGMIHTSGAFIAGSRTVADGNGCYYA